METLILVVGTLVVAAALTLILTGEDDPNRPLYTNITFAVGFLFYIIYNMISTSGLQGKIRDLESQVAGLKQELKKNKEALAKSEAEKQELQSKWQQSQQDLEKKDQELASLQATIKELKAAAEEK